MISNHHSCRLKTLQVVFSVETENPLSPQGRQKEKCGNEQTLRKQLRSRNGFLDGFLDLAEETGWEEKARWGAFVHGLSDYMQDELAGKELLVSLNSLVSMLPDKTAQMTYSWSSLPTSCFYGLAKPKYEKNSCNNSCL